MAETKIIYHMDEEETPYLVKLPVAPERVTLADFKNVLSNRPVHAYKFFFKSMDQDFGSVGRAAWAGVLALSRARAVAARGPPARAQAGTCLRRQGFRVWGRQRAPPVPATLLRIYSRCRQSPCALVTFGVDIYLPVCGKLGI